MAAKCIDGHDVATRGVVRSALTGATDGGSIVNTRVDSSGNIGVRVQGPLTVFGEVMVAEPTPVYQIAFSNDLVNDQLLQQFTGTGGTISVTDSRAALAITTSVGSYATLRSKRPVIYRAGQGAGCRFTAVFNTGVALSTQQAGPGNAQSALAFGYDGASFGVLRSTGGRYHVVKFTVTTASSASENATVTLNGTGFTVPVTNAGGDKSFTAYEIAKYASYTGWNAESIGDDVIFTFDGVGAKTGSYTFSSGTAACTVTTLATGTDLTNNWTPQASWNVDTCDGTGPSGFTINPQLGNVYRIVYQWLGFGAMTYEVENPITGRFIVVHVERYANTATTPSFTTPVLYMTWKVASLGATTAMTMYATSGAGFVHGKIVETLSPMYATDVTNPSIAANTETTLLSLRVLRDLNATYNHSQVRLRNLSVAVDGTKVSTIRVYINSTIGAGTTGNYTKWEYVSENASCVAVDKTALTSTGGIMFVTDIVSKTGSVTIDTDKLNLTGFNNDTICVTCESTGSTACAVSIVWGEAR